jgi:hypothetical protein
MMFHYNVTVFDGDFEECDNVGRSVAEANQGLPADFPRSLAAAQSQPSSHI